MATPAQGVEAVGGVVALLEGVWARSKRCMARTAEAQISLLNLPSLRPRNLLLVAYQQISLTISLGSSVAIISLSEKCSILRTGLCPNNVAYFGHDRPDETHNRLEATHSCAYPVGSRFGLDSYRLR